MISKKNLLKTMGISYGQLYRWKREGLIPEEWFIKQAASTGQETYFEQSLIIPRIEKILELKDKYQLEELKQFFNPHENELKMSVREAILIDDIDPLILKQYINRCDNYRVSLVELAIIYIFSTNKDVLCYDDFIECDFKNVKGVNSYFYILTDESKKYFILIAERGCFLDKKWTIVREIKMEDTISEIAKKFKEDFNE